MVYYWIGDESTWGWLWGWAESSGGAGCGVMPEHNYDQAAFDVNSFTTEGANFQCGLIDLDIQAISISGITKNPILDFKNLNTLTLAGLYINSPCSFELDNTKLRLGYIGGSSSHMLNNQNIPVMEVFGEDLDIEFSSTEIGDLILIPSIIANEFWFDGPFYVQNKLDIKANTNIIFYAGCTLDLNNKKYACCNCSLKDVEILNGELIVINGTNVSGNSDNIKFYTKNPAVGGGFF